MRVGRLTGGDAVFFTANLLADGYEKDEAKRIELVKTGLEALRRPDAKDSEYIRLRVLEGGKVWVIQEAGKLTYMLPSDY